MNTLGNPSMITTVTGEGIGAPNISTGSFGHDNSIEYTTNDPSMFFLDMYLFNK